MNLQYRVLTKAKEMGAIVNFESAIPKDGKKSNIYFKDGQNGHGSWANKYAHVITMLDGSRRALFYNNLTKGFEELNFDKETTLKEVKVNVKAHQRKINQQKESIPETSNITRFLNLFERFVIAFEKTANIDKPTI